MTEMNDENKPNFKVIEFKKPDEEETPKVVIEALEKMLERAKAGKLKTLIAHFNYQENEEEQNQGGTLFWNENNNPIELLGLTELIKSVALDNVYHMMHAEEEEE